MTLPGSARPDGDRPPLRQRRNRERGWNQKYRQHLRQISEARWVFERMREELALKETRRR